MDKINDIDAKILRFIKDHEPINLQTIVSGLPDIYAVEFRVKQMCSSGHYTHSRTTDHSSFYIQQDVRTYLDDSVTKQEYMDAYRLTDQGQTVLQDYMHSTKKYRRELWLKNAWIPIIVAFATTVLANYLLPKLPQILKWASSILVGILS